MPLFFALHLFNISFFLALHSLEMGIVLLLCLALLFLFYQVWLRVAFKMLLNNRPFPSNTSSCQPVRTWDVGFCECPLKSLYWSLPTVWCNFTGITCPKYGFDRGSRFGLELPVSFNDRLQKLTNFQSWLRKTFGISCVLTLNYLYPTSSLTPFVPFSNWLSPSLGLSQLQHDLQLQTQFLLHAKLDFKV